MTVTQLNHQRLQSGCRQMCEPESKSRMGISCSEGIRACKGHTSKRFGLTCIIKDLSERNQTVVTVSFLCRYWGDDRQKRATPPQVLSVLRKDPIVNRQASTISQTVGVTSKPKRIVDKRVQFSVLNLSHQHSNNGKDISVIDDRKSNSIEFKTLRVITLTQEIKQKTR